MVKNQTQNFIPIDNGWAFLEIEYNSKKISLRECNFLRILNTYDNSINFLNFNLTSYNEIKKLTNNVLDNTALLVSNNTYVLLDTDRPIKFYEETCPNLFFQNLNFKENIEITYHSIKIHILKGYNFEGLDGFLCKVFYSDDFNFNNTEKNIFVANQAFLKNNIRYLKKNIKPILNGHKLYSTYYEFLIPSFESLKTIYSLIPEKFKFMESMFFKNIENFENFPLNQNNTSIKILFYEIQKTAYDSQGRFVLKDLIPILNDENQTTTITLNIEDIYSDLSAIIRENVNGNYFELFPSFKGGFFEDYILNYNETNSNKLFINNFIIIHDIDIIEHFITNDNYDEQRTSSLSFIQSEGFDEPFIFRPVIKFNKTISFTIEYLVRIINLENNSQIVRRASLTYPFAEKYKKNYYKINDLNLLTQKIVNKIILNENNNFTKSNKNEIIYPYLKSISNDILNPIIGFSLPIDRNKIILSNKNLITKIDENGNEVLAEIDSLDVNKYNFYSAINSHELLIYPFDNFILFNLKEIEYVNGKQNLKDFNFINSENIEYYLNFLINENQYYKIKSLSFLNNFLDLKDGEILFKISKNDFDKIKNAKIYNISMRVLYSEKYRGLELNKIENIETIIFQGKVKNTLEL